MLSPRPILGAVASRLHEVDARKKEDKPHDKGHYRVHFAEVQAAHAEKTHSAHNDTNDTQNGEDAAEGAFLVHVKREEKVLIKK